jgi:flagellar biosynthetic protein FlhB
VAEEQGQEKTEEPTARKLTQARERGELPRSPDFGGAMEVLVICLLMFFIGAEIVDGFSEMLKNGLTFDRSDLDDVENLPLVAGARLFEGLWAVKWILLASIIVALLASTLNGGFNFSGQAAAPKLSKLNPLSGLKRMFGAQAWIGLLRNLLKFFAIAAVLGFVGRFTRTRDLHLS